MIRKAIRGRVISIQTDDGVFFLAKTGGVVTTTGATSARLLSITACGCYAVSDCNNLVNAAGARAVQVITNITCPFGMLYCCPTAPAPTTTTTTTTTTTLAPLVTCACFAVTNCATLTPAGSTGIDFRIVTPVSIELQLQ